MKKSLWLLVLFMGLISVARAEDESKRNNRVVFRGNYVNLSSSRGGEVFTDTGSAAGTNSSKGGIGVSAALDLGMSEPNSIFGVASVMGGVSVDFARFSNQLVRQTTSALLGGVGNSRVNVTELNVGVAPKLRFDCWGKFQPYVMPVGLAFLVISPPSNDSTYLDLGLNFGGGMDYRILDWLSVGIDAKYTLGFESANTNSSYMTVGGGVGVHF